MAYSPEFTFNNPEEITGEPEYLTQEGFEDLHKELEDLQSEILNIAGELEKAIDDGDLTENASYQELKNRQGSVQSRINELEDILGRAVLILKEKSSNIQLGSSVSLRKEGSDKVEKFSLVGAEEANPMKGKISNESPLGMELLGKKKGDRAEAFAPSGKVIYNIIDVD